MSVDNRENEKEFVSKDAGENGTLQSKNLVAFLTVSLAAAITPFLGFWGFLVLCASFAAALAACSSALKFVFFLPGTALALFIYGVTGTHLIPAACGLAFSVVCAAVLGVVIYRRQSASVQTLCVGVASAILAIAAFASYALYAYGSLSEAVLTVENALGSYLNEIFDLLAAAAKRYTESDPQSAALLGVGEISSFNTEAFLRTLILSAPGIVAGLALVFGWLVQLVSRPFLILFGRRDIVTDKKRIVLPLSLAFVYLGFSFVSLFSSGETFIAVVAANVANALVPALFCVGIGYISDFFRSPRGRFPTMLVVMFVFSALLMPSFFISFVRVAGIVGTITSGIRARMEKER